MRGIPITLDVDVELATDEFDSVELVALASTASSTTSTSSEADGDVLEALSSPRGASDDDAAAADLDENLSRGGGDDARDALGLRTKYRDGYPRPLARGQ